jgi:hypothetical protein
MTKKRKIIDIIFFNGEIDVLKFRLSELNSFVDMFIIIESLSNSSELVKHSNFFDKYKEKYIHLYASVNLNPEDKIELVNKTLVKLKLNFEDVIVISNVNEVPDFNNFEGVIEELKFDVVLLNHLKFVWSINYVDKRKDSGSFIFFYTMLLQNKPEIKQYYLNKESNNITCEKIENGWKFVGFELKDREGFEYQVEEKLPMDKFNSLTTYQLTESNLNDLPINYKLLPKNKIGRNSVKNHLFVINSLSGTTIEELEKQYDTVSIIEFISGVNEMLGEKISDKTVKHSIFVPTSILYGDGDLEKFQHDYRLNEIERLKHSIFKKEQDTITII